MSFEERTRQKKLEEFKKRFKFRKLLKKKPAVLKPAPISKITGKPVTPKKKPTAKGTAAAKKAWETRRAKAEDPVQAEVERQEALRILDELAKNRPPATEE